MIMGEYMFAKYVTPFLDSIQHLIPYTVLGIVFSYIRIAFIGERTPREALMIYFTGAALATLTGYSMTQLQVNQGWVYPTIAFVVLISENIVQAALKIGAALSKDPEAFIQRWTGRGK